MTRQKIPGWPLRPPLKFAREKTQNNTKEMHSGPCGPPAGKSGFAGGVQSANRSGMTNPDPALEDARRAGIDLNLLDLNLALTYEERVLRHESALELVLALRKAGAAHEKSARPAAAVR